MGRDVATAADRTLTPVAITFVDGGVRHGLAPRLPRFDERCAEKTEEGRLGGGRPAPQKYGFEPAVVASGALANAEAQRHSTPTAGVGVGGGGGVGGEGGGGV